MLRQEISAKYNVVKAFVQNKEDNSDVAAGDTDARGAHASDGWHAAILQLEHVTRQASELCVRGSIEFITEIGTLASIKARTGTPSTFMPSKLSLVGSVKRKFSVKVGNAASPLGAAFAGFPM